MVYEEVKEIDKLEVNNLNCDKFVGVIIVVGIGVGFGLVIVFMVGVVNILCKFWIY